MGHKSLAMTDYYSHVGVDEEENAMAKLEGKMAWVHFLKLGVLYK
jgi:hypothetical protein